MIPFPYADENPLPGKNIAVISLIVLNILGILYWSPEFYASLGFVPASPKLHQWLSSMFLHSGLFHLAGNMWFLWLFGDNVEARFGRAFAPFYVVSGISANFIYRCIYPQSTIPCIGASGAISGVMGAYFMLFPSARLRCVSFFGVIFARYSLSALGFGAVYLLWQTFMMTMRGNDGVAYGAHFGGLLFGAVVGGLAKPAESETAVGLSGAAGQRPREASASEEVLRLIAEGREEPAAHAYVQALRLNPYLELPENEQLWMADRLARFGQPHLAKDALERFLLRHPKTSSAAHASLLAGYVQRECFLDLPEAAKSYRAALDHPAASEETRAQAKSRLDEVQGLLARTSDSALGSGRHWVLQEDRTPLDDEALRALARITGEGEGDVAARLRQSPGMLLAGVHAGEAARSAVLLEDAGIHAVVIPEERLLLAPAPILCRSLSGTAGELSFVEQNGAGGRIPWSECLLIAAAGVKVSRMTAKPDDSIDIYIPSEYWHGGYSRGRRGGYYHIGSPTEYEPGSALVPMIEIFRLTPWERYRWIPSLDAPDFESVRGRFFDVLQELVLNAVDVPINRGAHAAFQRELPREELYPEIAAWEGRLHWDIQLAALRKEGAYRRWTSKPTA